MRNVWIGALTAALWLCCPAFAGVDFETIDDFALGVEDYELAGDHGGTFSSGGATFAGYHHVDPPWDWWGGYAVSNRTAVGADDPLKQYTSAPGTDHTIGAGGAYAIAYEDWESPIGCRLDFAQPTDVEGMWITNVAWTAEWIPDNYGPDDFYRLWVTAYDDNLDVIGMRNVELTDNTDWTWYTMGWQGVSTIGITMQSSNDWTPKYVCIDDINVPEPATAVLLAGGFLAAGLRRRRGARRI